MPGTGMQFISLSCEVNCFYVHVIIDTEGETLLKDSFFPLTLSFYSEVLFREDYFSVVVVCRG